MAGNRTTGTPDDSMIIGLLEERSEEALRLIGAKYGKTMRSIARVIGGNDRREETVMTLSPGIRSGTTAFGTDYDIGYCRLDLSTGEKKAVSLPESANSVRLTGGMLYIMTCDDDELVTMEKIKEFESQNDMHARDYKEKVYAFLDQLRSGATSRQWRCREKTSR